MFLDLELSTIILLFVLGFLAAFIDSVVGGGGLISLPALMFTGLSPSAAVATNKLAGTMGSFTSTVTFYRSGKLELKTIIKLFPIVFIAAAIGAWIVHLMDPTLLKPLMLIMLAGVLVYTIFKKDWGSISTYEKLSPIKYFGFFLLVFAIGFYDGFLGPGTGSFLIFAFLMIGFDFLRAAGNAKFLNFGSNIGALIMFMFLGQINYAYGLIMGVAQIIGAICGSKYAIKRGSGYVRGLFIIVTIILLAKNAYDFFI
ncbi:membrane protein [Ureibacillus massiliensis 4400831 = CIP 108448 = CCUG 49529]|uniref:Probable membrane transporter protein n=1 Tax=Ureibacillus massiliensis 4400831 = CIP 108448 = CCUG 49529 TaxID=1211035 RepID=A0A0A3J7P2_9BACL|nr:TSUP family transporter [Ureibacillus massiliensis]KGR91760.1 membrane protein [Ureibacillus massiliensis 4400831 = CIP 108448 = CCUG 49529]